MKKVEIETRATKDILTGEICAVAFIDCDAYDTHGAVGLFMTAHNIVVVTDCPTYEEDMEFDDLAMAMQYYRREKARVVNAVSKKVND